MVALFIITSQAGCYSTLGGLCEPKGNFVECYVEIEHERKARLRIDTLLAYRSSLVTSELFFFILSIVYAGTLWMDKYLICHPQHPKVNKWALQMIWVPLVKLAINPDQLKSQNIPKNTFFDISIGLLKTIYFTSHNPFWCI